MSLAMCRAACVSVALSLLASWAGAMQWQWLEQMRQAVQFTDYRGEFVHRRGDELSAYSVVHRYKDGSMTELLQQLDGDMIEVLRTGDELICYYPEGSSSAVSHAIPAAPFSKVAKLDVERISGNYSASVQNEERVAGYITRVVVLTGDDWRFSHKLWLEQKTGLLLQSEMIDQKGQVVEQFRFTRIEIDVDIADQELRSTLALVSDRQQVISLNKKPKGDTDNDFSSTLSWLPEGFELARAHAGMQAEKWTEMRNYSDGFTSFSVFVEKGVAMKGESAIAKMGATTAVMLDKAGYAITVLGEVPEATARQVASNIHIEAWDL
ncbi:MucB/RseB C-terminal domain-containing protein [Reinekea thalattae]|uniref:Transcriptional regulator n=1 Tax=Reinekea thalattae TaxID=2593301 RepID=A0A5C8Z707_9GAMM|nr:MucB/RseB C-terminal domain-containing protein [Reinekea thalattae]TXR53074.1 hypothetical protein FME95_00395 [Reinekea thalattae]